MTSLDQSASGNSSDQPSTAGHDASDAEATTAAWLLAGLAGRLRAAYEQGADIQWLAEACRQPEAEVRRLLELAGTVLVASPRNAAFDDPAILTGSLQSWQQFRQLRRPTPSRRLSRLHPRHEPEVEPDPGAGSTPGTGSGDTAQPLAAITAPAQAQEPTSTSPQTPMGILIGASPTYAEPATASGALSPCRVPVELVRLSRGTSLVVLPSWRTAIAVSVPTDPLLAETGLTFDELSEARLTVLMNPDALHDRELELRDWRTQHRRGAGSRS
ncbi:hypothetical protein [Kitasatospora sp. GP82]|uniref:hypothetical protein n=1 Tax=Kitasatospora sp. GP82 TaxID=3035089 RepID=UPI0024759816|nr:hypothetical protein [Kitasatospora sp. GP82]MDH6126551.1 hypothetical protein [Kitasatospora sp. GP82]